MGIDGAEHCFVSASVSADGDFGVSAAGDDACADGALLLLGYVGPVSAATCTAILFGLSTTFFGFWGAALSALLLVPVLVVSGCMVERGRGFWQSACRVKG